MAAWLHNHFDIMNALQREVPPQGKTNQHFTVCAPSEPLQLHEGLSPPGASIILWHHQHKPPTSSPPAPTWNHFLFLKKINIYIHVLFPNCCGTHARGPESSPIWLEEKVDKKCHLKLCQREKMKLRAGGAKNRRTFVSVRVRSRRTNQSGYVSLLRLPSGVLLCVWGAALCDVYIHVLTLITVTFHTGKGASWDVTSKDQHTK